MRLSFGLTSSASSDMLFANPILRLRLSLDGYARELTLETRDGEMVGERKTSHMSQSRRYASCT